MPVVAELAPAPGFLQESPTGEIPGGPELPNILDNCKKPGDGASIAELMAYVDCLTAQLNTKP